MTFIGVDECLLEKYFVEAKLIDIFQFKGLNWRVLAISMTKMPIYSNSIFSSLSYSFCFI